MISRRLSRMEDNIIRLGNINIQEQINYQDNSILLGSLKDKYARLQTEYNYIQQFKLPLNTNNQRLPIQIVQIIMQYNGDGAIFWLINKRIRSSQSIFRQVEIPVLFVSLDYIYCFKDLDQQQDRNIAWSGYIPKINQQNTYQYFIYSSKQNILHINLQLLNYLSSIGLTFKFKYYQPGQCNVQEIDCGSQCIRYVYIPDNNQQDDQQVYTIYPDLRLTFNEHVWFNFGSLQNYQLTNSKLDILQSQQLLQQLLYLICQQRDQRHLNTYIDSFRSYQFDPNYSDYCNQYLMYD